MSAMELALQEARAAASRNEVPVGAVVLGPDGAVLARAGNQVEALADPTAHAEMLAMRAAAQRLGSSRLTGCDLVCTLEPCPMCAGAAVHFRIRRVLFGAYDPKGGGVEHGPRVFAQPGCLHRPQVVGGVRATAAGDLLRTFFAARRPAAASCRGLVSGNASEPPILDEPTGGTMDSQAILPRQRAVPLPVQFRTVRSHTEALAAALSPEDQCVQSMPDASPAKWHRAHTTWFFEQFVLTPHLPEYRTADPRFAYLFNSYYDAVGARHPRPARGLLTRPSATEVTAYRAHVDAAMDALLARSPDLDALVELGLHHEQQHQELLLTDILHAFAQTPLLPAALPGWTEPAGVPGAPRWIGCPGGTAEIGHGAPGSPPGFSFDNEGPRHAVLLQPYALADRLVRNRDWLAFMQAGGYATPALWMSDGWSAVQAEGWQAPLHWRQDGDTWLQFGPGGAVPLNPDDPVRHVCWYEADAFARWSDARLPTEAEWEAAAVNPALHEMTGHAWQWTESAYRPYPGFRPPPGAIGEYNGKFMINTMVLRGGSWATPPGHLRPSYRNFFHPDKRWQVTGLRLARDA